MPATADALRPQAHVQFQDLEIGEPITVRLACFHSTADIRASLKMLRRPPTPNLTLVIHLPRRLGGQELMGLLDQATGMAGRVVLTPPQENTTGSERQFQMAGRQKWPCQVQIEPEALRAVVGAMQSLKAGDTLALLWPDEVGMADPASLVALGARWRASWEVPEDGEFYWLPHGGDIP